MLKHLKLENFRNHENYAISLEKTTVLLGRNGAGKSNVLEAITMLSFCRSFREEDRKNLVLRGREYAKVTGDELELFISKVPRLKITARKKGVNQKSKEFIGQLPSVVFSPETVSIVTGSPAERRRFLDAMISQVDKEYLESIIDYGKVRKQRNNLLERIRIGQSTASELDFWNRELVSLSKIIEQKRGEAVTYINNLISSLYKKISGQNKSELNIEYVKSSKGDLMGRIEQFLSREIAAGTTIFGPHRDDLVFRLNNENAANFASRGEIRSVILALKIAELNFLDNNLKNRANTQPILLLDDVFSEFDKERREHLGRLVLDYQTIITATEKEHISSDLLKQAKVVELGG